MKEKRTVPAFLKKSFTLQDMDAIADAVRDVEKKTAGEVRVSIKEKRTKQEKDIALLDLALQDFYRLGMNNTRDATGVLLFILFGERKLQIVADKGIYECIPQNIWDEIAGDMATRFKEGNFTEGILLGIDRCGKILEKEFPIQPGDVNELPDDVSIS